MLPYEEILLAFRCNIVAAAIIGWTNSNKSLSFSNGSASDGSVSFNYPADMENNTNYQTIIIGAEN